MNTNLLRKEIDDVLNRHRITPAYQAHFWTLIHEGRITDAGFRTRLKHVVNYEAALYDILELLSRPLRHLFEPASFESLGASHDY